jgi:AcrR family transcriptional regulator
LTTATRSTGLAEFQRRRKEGSREQMLAAATEAFCAHGYFAVSVEDIASAAGVSRMTFYRHFSGKPAIATELFRLNTQAAMPRLLAIGQTDFRDRVVVEQWVAGLFAADRASRQLLRVFIQANVDETDFTENAHSFIDDIITGLAQTIPAFALDGAKPLERRRWLEAWLLLYEILDQGNHAARESGVATDPLVAEILAERFLAFVTADAA